MYTKLVKAGKRTYFFDVKATRQGDHYLTVTESKKRFSEDGRFTFEKHKIFLYREDFEKFVEAMRDVMDYVHAQPIPDSVYQHQQSAPQQEEAQPNNESGNFSNISFEDI